MVTNSGSVLSNIQSKPIRMHQKAKPSTRRSIARQNVVVGRSDPAPLVPAGRFGFPAFFVATFYRDSIRKMQAGS